MLKVALAPGIKVGDRIPDHRNVRTVVALTLGPGTGDPDVRIVLASVSRLPRERNDRVVREMQYKEQRVLLFDTTDGSLLGDSRGSVYGGGRDILDEGLIAGMLLAQGKAVTLTADDIQAMGLGEGA